MASELWDQSDKCRTLAIQRILAGSIFFHLQRSGKSRLSSSIIDNKYMD